ncbi:MAG: class I SAM-dependent methyltransferase [Pirellulales bacterium]
MFGRRLQKRARHLRRWPTKQGITCYRLYERDVPEIPLIVDRYEDHLHITEYDRPHDRDAGQHADWLDLMMRKAAEVLDVDHRKVFLKCRRRQRGRSQHGQLADRRYEVTVREAGLRFIVNLSDYVDTGLFLDHRITRSMVREAAEGATFLNLFGYTGGFTVYAAAGGAARTTTVDWSHTYLDWSKRNLCLNEFESERHSFVRADAASYLQQLPRHETYDLAVVDPPTFSNRKGVDDHWDVQRDHVELLNELMLRMKPGGQIYFSTNFRRFKLDEAAIQSASIFEISRQTVPSDFRNRRVHRCWRLRRET